MNSPISRLNLDVTLALFLAIYHLWLFCLEPPNVKVKP